LVRLPVRDAPGGRIVGLVNLRTSLYLAEPDRKRTAGDYLQPALYLSEGMRLEVALRRLRESGQRMAIVLDRGRREIGIVTLEDILRFIFGDITL
jgi:CBS domain containing-hemolysin-like protein